MILTPPLRNLIAEPAYTNLSREELFLTLRKGSHKLRATVFPVTISD